MSITIVSYSNLLSSWLIETTCYFELGGIFRVLLSLLAPSVLDLFWKYHAQAAMYQYNGVRSERFYFLGRRITGVIFIQCFERTNVL